MKSKLYTIKEASLILNVHWKTLYNWIRDNKVKAVQIGRAWKISKEELDFIQNNGLH